jgi:predicted GNAT superfamily acetyltransferase
LKPSGARRGIITRRPTFLNATRERKTSRAPIVRRNTKSLNGARSAEGTVEHASPLANQSMSPFVVSGCDITIRPLTTLDELAACVDVQRSVWGWADVDLMPLRLFVLMQHVGGVVLGAYHDDRLVGFVNCVPGLHDGRPFWHSHMMGVLPPYQNRGIGTALKLAQKRHALDRGITSIQWVFDPLEAKNAYLNIAKLGAVVRRYSINHYGASTSPLHAGLDSDRLVAEWRLDAPPIVVRPWDHRTVFVPDNVQAMRRLDPPAVKRLQLAVREQFLRNLSQRLIAAGCERHPHGSTYVFTPDAAWTARLPLGDVTEEDQNVGG